MKVSNKISRKPFRWNSYCTMRTNRRTDEAASRSQQQTLAYGMRTHLNTIHLNVYFVDIISNSAIQPTIALNEPPSPPTTLDICKNFTFPSYLFKILIGCPSFKQIATLSTGQFFLHFVCLSSPHCIVLLITCLGVTWCALPIIYKICA